MMRTRPRLSPRLPGMLAPTLLCALCAATSASALSDTPAPGTAEAEAQRRADEERRRAAAEEMFLRLQLEMQLNELARYNPETGRLELRERSEDDAPTTLALEALLEIVAEPGGGTRLQIRRDIKIRPFVLAFQKFMASGGARDLERLQRGENPFADGLPAHAEALLADLVEALNAQDDDSLSEQERQREREREAFYARVERLLREGLELSEPEIERRMRLVRALDRRLQRELAGDRWRRRVREILESRRTEAALARLREAAERLAESEEAQELLEQLGEEAERLAGSEETRQLLERLRRALQRRRGPDRPAPQRPSEGRSPQDEPEAF